MHVMLRDMYPRREASRMEKIFVVEDDENIRNLVKIALEGYGYKVLAFETAEEALDCIEEESPDLGVFDLMLPGMDGLSAISIIRKKDRLADMPLVVLTAKDKEYDKVVGLDGGADDYITKPFGILELTARIRSLLRRTKRTIVEEKDVRLQYGHLSIDTAIRQVKINNDIVMLTYKEYELLMYLVENQHRVVSREELLDKIWDYNSEIETRTLDIHIRTLRQKLGAIGNEYINTIRSVGYRFQKEE